MISWIKKKIAEWKYRRKLKEKMKRMKEEDPFIYD
tara:strand:- start:198 stop:302 length:105 start_codon:yes stop_codon:yes gene_type:complete